MTSAGYGSTANQAQAVSLARSYTNDAANRLTNWSYVNNVNASSFPVQTDTYTYDNNGNRLTKQAVLTGQSATPQQTNYAYDFENRLNQLQYTNIPNIVGTQTDYLSYNGEGLRTQANINNAISAYFYDGSNISVEQDVSGNTTKTYTRAVGFPGGINGLIDQNYTVSGTPTVQYYGYDDLGSTADLTTSTGTTASSYSYDAYGNLLTTPASSDTNRYFFSTKEFDARSGLDYFGARYYDPEIGRWLTPDPLGLKIGPNVAAYGVIEGTPLTINPLVNLNAYTGNSPVNFVDPDGLHTAEDCALQYQADLAACNAYEGDDFFHCRYQAAEDYDLCKSFATNMPNPTPPMTPIQPPIGGGSCPPSLNPAQSSS